METLEKIVGYACWGVILIPSSIAVYACVKSLISDYKKEYQKNKQECGKKGYEQKNGQSCP